ncbi:sigma factor-like helix-turn-helix DNA-binding protein [Actinoplanes subtropicus]|uniref:sigma factor-like helix-turn-helix DNA-binding protein n=1 Tax=Actinoplanes subtropicus TaxID=543632 RepID=UPI00147070B6
MREAFARVLAAPRSFLDAEEPERWLRVAALNVARTRYRRRWVFDRLVRSGRVEIAREAAPGLSRDRVALLAALRRLAPPTREAVVLHHLADLPVAEVAATLGVPEGTVKARLARGRASPGRDSRRRRSTRTGGRSDGRPSRGGCGFRSSARPWRRGSSRRRGSGRLCAPTRRRRSGCGPAPACRPLCTHRARTCSSLIPGSPSCPRRSR